MYRIKNWREFQHYKDRNPPWIKLHFSILSSDDWVTLDDTSRVLAIACMLLGSKKDGMIDGSNHGLEYIKRVAYLKKLPNLKPLISCGFLEPASECKQMLADARPETEAEHINTDREETEAEGSERTARAPSFTLPFQPEGWNSESETDGITGSNGHRLATNGSAASGLDPALQVILAECPHLALISTGASSTFWDQVLAICEPYPQAGPAWLNAKIRKWNQWFEDNKGRRSRKREFLQSRIMRWLEKDLEHLAMRKT